MALEIGAMPTENWSGCHAVGWDRNAPEFGDLAVGDNFSETLIPLGHHDQRQRRAFSSTKAQISATILTRSTAEPFDKKMISMLRDEYRIKQTTKVRADTLNDLVKKLDDVDAEHALETIKAYNRTVCTDIPFNPNIKDGRRTKGLAIDKSNWANTVDEPSFEAYAVTCGVTFTFGGLKIDTSGRVMDTDGKPIPGLYAVGELVGGLFYLPARCADYVITVIVQQERSQFHS